MSSVASRLCCRQPVQCPSRWLAWQDADACTWAARRYLFVAAMVASSVLIRRYHQRGVTKAAPTIARWLLIVAFSIGARCSSAVPKHALSPEPLKI